MLMLLNEQLPCDAGRQLLSACCCMQGRRATPTQPLTWQAGINTDVTGVCYVACNPICQTHLWIDDGVYWRITTRHRTALIPVTVQIQAEFTITCLQSRA